MNQEASIFASNIDVNKKTGEYSFDIYIDSEEAYAGAELGVFCSEETEISSVSSSTGTVTGPKEVNGLVWFGFFDGKDSIYQETCITVEGTLNTEKEAAILIQDAKIYTIGNQEYKTELLESNVMVELHKAPLSFERIVEEKGISAVILIGCCVVIAAATVSALIYIKTKHSRKKRRQEDDFKECK